MKSLFLIAALALPSSPLLQFKELMAFLVYRHPHSSFCFLAEHETPRHQDGWRYTELRWQKFRIFERSA